MASHGLVKTELAEDADILLMNTCSIREKAQEKVFSELGRWRDLKHKKPHLIIGVGGCVASQEGKAILQRAPYVDLIFGPQTIHRLGEMLSERHEKKKPVIDISFPEIEKFDRLPAPRAEGPTAYVTIMEGCSKYCSYCVVPYTRGEEISRPLDDVLHEVVALSEQGVKEIIFLGQNVNDYCGPMHDGHLADLSTLIEYTAALENIVRIRFTTSHPLAFSQRLIATYASTQKLVNHLHLPVQSGSDRILSAMKRGYTSLEFKSKIRRLRELRPGIAVSTDFIVGFPGENEADFQATMDLVKAVYLDQSFSFIYSPRPGTPAATLPDNVSMDTKKARLHRLQEAINANALAISQSMVGSIQPILITQLSPKKPGYLSGRSENNRMVHVPGHPRLLGQLLPIKIKEALPNVLKGEIVASF